MQDDQQDNEIVEQLYQSILKRPSDEAGKSHYVQLLKSGSSIGDLIKIFIESDEFNNSRPTDYNIRLDDVRYWHGFGQAEIDYVRQWQDKTLVGKEGFLTDFVGMRTRIDILWDECRQYDGTVHPLPIPTDYHADILEYVGTLRAVDNANGSFSVMELGAGMGPWTVTAAVAARRRGISDIFLCAVEGDPERHRMMLQHLKDNGLESVPQEILQAGVSTQDGEAYWPRLDSPTNQSGARPLKEGNLDDATYLDHGFDISDDLIRIPLVAFGGLLDKRPFWDLIHIDVQGTEAELCAAAIDKLDERVRYMVIGTHSRKIDGELIEIFHSAGWILENEKPAIFQYNRDIPITHMTFGDGTQIWRNPRY